MPYNDLREFLDACRKSGDLIEIDRPIDTDLEIGRALKKSYSKNGPVIIFDNPIDKDFPVVAGIFGTRERALLAFDSTEDNILDNFLYGLNHPIDPVLIDEAPCHEVVLTGDDIDLTRLPIPKFSPLDGGPYLTAGITVSKDPETGIPDIGYFRYLLQDKNTFGWFAQPFHRFGKNCAKAKAMGLKKYEAAIILGNDPILGYTCSIKQVSDDTNDWTLAGGLRGAPVELVKCKTIDVEVPATSEFVFEIEVDFADERPEGPLGEYTGYMTPSADRPVCRVKAITHRNNPLFQVLLTGKPITENHILKNIPFEASFLKAMRAQFPTITGISVRPSGGCQAYVVIAMNQRFEGEARQAILAAMASNVRPKWVIIVDPDIDVYDSSEVEWAMSYRVVPGRDVILVKNVPSVPLDPSSRGNEKTQMRMNDSIGIDATIPYGGDFNVTADVPGWREYSFPELDK
jgi:4-hydroxy-3-polyprenylbenzoate decarboxylase/2,5-furandicarboxylate decarboxylase 1